MGAQNGIRKQRRYLPARILTYPEVVEQYRDERVLMEVTGRGKHHDPIGRVLAHSRRKGNVSRVLAKLPRASGPPADTPRNPYYAFQAYPFLIPTFRLTLSVT
jgi:hypothetical protein